MLRLEGPMQAWGTRGRYSIRDTDAEPSKSGVLGLLGCALGMRRDDQDTLDQLRRLRMAVRVDRPGRIIRDLHTVGAGTFRGEPHSMWGLKDKTVLTQRFYLVDAAFTVAVGGDDNALLDRIAAAVQDPVWPMFLGRRSCVPSEPIFLAVAPTSPEDALRHAPLARGAESRLRVIMDAPAGIAGSPRPDDPIRLASDDRQFAFRQVHECWLDFAPEGGSSSP
ncbi:MAG: type I-E CRISPR-associated protein Cas5/CasD [Planctomycetes bacterium]|nr:type I-E CRISPR-associated protein Cas5/CasD [Planctomycetota bacterium]